MIVSENRLLIRIKSEARLFGIIFLEYANHDDKANHHADCRQAGP